MDGGKEGPTVLDDAGQAREERRHNAKENDADKATAVDVRACVCVSVAEGGCVRCAFHTHRAKTIEEGVG